MRKIHKIRLENARKLAARFDSQSAFADAIRRVPTQVSRFMGKNPSKVIGDELASEIESSLGLEEGCLDLQDLGQPTISSLEKDIAEAVLQAPQDVQDVIQALITRYLEDEADGGEVAKAIKKLLGI